MLPPFHIRNLQPNLSQDSLVQISAPCYDETISTYPAATLKYHDEDDGDLITIGSSRELTQKLEEPVLPHSLDVPTMSQQDMRSLQNHVFEIVDHDSVRKIWQDKKDSKCVPCAHLQDHATDWSEEKKTLLAAFYDEQRHEIWSPIARELGVTWQSVDAMHFALGEEELARRALGLNASTGHSGSSGKRTELKPDSMLNTEMPQSENYRIHHFNATRQSQIQMPKSVTPKPSKTRVATVSKVSDTSLDCSAWSFQDNNGSMDGKRQARAADGKLRSRMSAADSHQSTRASYEPSISAVHTKPSTSPGLAFDGSGLTAEGKRQAQVAGDRLRYRTSPIFHSRSSRAGASEHAISKNRWPSYSGTRAARFHERQDAQDEATTTLNTADIEEKGPRGGQPSLLEVFEAELAKETSTANSETGMGSEQSGVRSPVPELAEGIDPSSESQSRQLPQRPQVLLGLINERLQSITAGDTAFSQDFTTAIDHGMRTAGAALSGLGACIQSIVRGLQEASTDSRLSADKIGHDDLQLIDNALLRFQGLLRGPTVTSRKETAANLAASTSAICSRSEAVGGPNLTSWGTSDVRNPEGDTSTAYKSDQTSLNKSDGSSKLASSPSPIRAAVPSCIFEKSASPQPETESEPGPRPSMNYLRPSQSARTLDEPYSIQRTNSPALQTHCPSSTASFPALPSMKPLVPQRAPYQYRYGSKAGESKPTINSLSFSSDFNGAETSCRLNKSVAGHPEPFEQSGHEVVPPSRLDSVARLAGPFDPVEAEPSARFHFTDGLWRNATIANTDIRPTARHAKPYSEVYDGSGRIKWSTFLQGDGRDRGATHKARDGLLDANQELPKRQPLPKIDLLRHSPFAAAVYDDQHHDDTTAGKINECVERLQDLGFGGKDEYSAGRLLIYAQAAEGVLGDAIDIIDEEQRAWQRL